MHSLRRNKSVWLLATLLAGISLACNLSTLPGRSSPEVKAGGPFTLSEAAVTTSSGLTFEDLAMGDGRTAQVGDTVSVIYTGYLEDDTQFDSNAGSGIPFEFQLGAGYVIQGWDEGLVGMRVGGRRLLVIPPDLAYGPSGAGGVIPPNATLTFEVTLLGIR